MKKGSFDFETEFIRFFEKLIGTDISEEYLKILKKIGENRK